MDDAERERAHPGILDQGDVRAAASPGWSAAGAPQHCVHVLGKVGKG